MFYVDMSECGDILGCNLPVCLKFRKVLCILLLFDLWFQIKTKAIVVIEIVQGKLSVVFSYFEG